MKWRGRFGWILLGPTEHRVARYLDVATRHGRVTLRMTRIQADCGLGRSEAYRIVRQLRILGLFGVENDQAGTAGGRRIWRIGRPDGQSLDELLHRQAWARISAWMRARRASILARVRSVSAGAVRRSSPPPSPRRQAAGQHRRQVATPGVGPPLNMRAAMLAWAPALAKEWRL